MEKKLNCILLIDDSSADNRFHQIIIEKMNITDCIKFSLNGIEAINLLQNENSIIPELILLDINMPKMNGWEFLEAYKNLDPKQKAKIIIVMITTSANPADKERAEKIAEVNGFITKPLSVKLMNEILEKHFK